MRQPKTPRPSWWPLAAGLTAMAWALMMLMEFIPPAVPVVPAKATVSAGVRA